MQGSGTVAPKKVTSFRPSDEVVRMLDDLEADMGIKRSAIIEVAVRELHRKQFRGRKPPKSGENPREST